ncbi:MAG: TRAP transporter substrate-binding protein DctP [Deltaproteobacteria bacterium]|nr:TRAP transporter substrate-binding protein DctP [Deltaproteobacteria bacterium]
MKKTKPEIIFLLVLMFLLVAAAFSFAASPAEPTRDTRTLFGHDVEGLKPVTLIVPSDANHKTLTDANMMHLAMLIEAESKGQIKLDLHRHGSLYRSNDYPKVLPIGTIHIAAINKGQLMSREKRFGPWIVGYIWKSPEHLFSVPCSPEWYEMEEKLAKEKWNMKPMALAPVGNWDYWSKKEVRSMKDLGGKKIWSYGEMSNAYIAAWGGTPVAKSGSEMYMSYYKGGLDVISMSILGYLNFKFWECGKYYVNMPVYPPGSCGIHYVQFYMNRDKWNSLPIAYRKIILDALDLINAVGIWEIICEEKMALYRLINEHKVVDCGIATEHPEEYEKIRKAAVEAGKKYVFDRGVTQAQWDEAQNILKKYADPKHTSRYSWFFKLAWAEADRRLAQVKKDLAAGKTWNEAYDAYHPKHRYDWTVEKIKKEWMAVPRVKMDWNEATRLQ